MSSIRICYDNTLITLYKNLQCLCVKMFCLHGPEVCVMELGFPSLFVFLFYFCKIFHVKIFFHNMWGCEENKGDARIPPPPGRVKDGGILRAGR